MILKKLNNVYIKDLDSLSFKLKNIKKDNISNLHIISDFDKTLNKLNLKSGKFKSVISIIRDGNYLENNYSIKANNLYNYYHAFEIDEDISFEDKFNKMEEWWTKHIKLLSESKMHKDVIVDILSKDTIQLREGVSDFLNLLYTNDISLLIFSSGLGDIITGFLNNKKLLFSNTHVVSNFFDWDENGFCRPMYKDNKVIHLLNKNETVLKKYNYFEKIKFKKNIILLGDSLEDLNMSKGFNYNNLISIGFLNENINKRLQSYINNFDIVIVNDGSFEQVLEVINFII